ncbi:uncharacterized protein [Populus alba]|uniref:uncharacterized protein n=1 Tax=Populus alba TaxID=43335 RepID=UPI003CC74CA7
MDQVKATAAFVANRSSHVVVDSAGLEKVVENIQDKIPKIEWDFEGIHYFDSGPLTVQYLFVLDTLNFCFWPDKNLNYDDFGFGLKEAFGKMTNLYLMLTICKSSPVGFELERSFGGKASNLVESCGRSAAKLVATIASHFPGFRDHSVYKGHQIFLYKRAQIFAADLYGAFKGQGYGDFNDISSITIFADYIVPKKLCCGKLGVLNIVSTLASIIESNKEIVSGSEEEVELRACSIYAVEKMRDLISVKLGKQVWWN